MTPAVLADNFAYLHSRYSLPGLVISGSNDYTSRVCDDGSTLSVRISVGLSSSVLDYLDVEVFILYIF